MCPSELEYLVFNNAKSSHYPHLGPSLVWLRETLEENQQFNHV